MERRFMNKEEIFELFGISKRKRKFLINVTIKENETNKKIK